MSNTCGAVDCNDSIPSDEMFCPEHGGMTYCACDRYRPGEPNSINPKCKLHGARAPISAGTFAPYTDNINHPPHYTHGGIETIDVIEAWGLSFCLGNVIKYISRANHKGSRLDDLKKAAWYLKREIERLEK